MINLFNISKLILTEQEGKISDLRTAIIEKRPISIYYSGPAGEVLPGQRIDILPVVMGNNVKSGNLVIWAYVFKGISKKGIPNWKMFRIDRIKSTKFNPKLKSFDLSKIPGYVKGKAPSMMKSLNNIQAYSPYWDTQKYPIGPELGKIEPQKGEIPSKPSVTAKPEEIPTVAPEPGPIEKPEISTKRHDIDVYNQLKTKIQDVNGIKSISPQEYQDAINDLYRKKEDEWREYQKMIGNNERPGEGTRIRFNKTSKNDIDKLLKKDNVQISNTTETLSEMIKRFKVLINL